MTYIYGTMLKNEYTEHKRLLDKIFEGFYDTGDRANFVCLIDTPYSESEFDELIHIQRYYNSKVVDLINSQKLVLNDTDLTFQFNGFTGTERVRIKEFIDWISTDEFLSPQDIKINEYICDLATETGLREVQSWESYVTSGVDIVDRFIKENLSLRTSSGLSERLHQMMSLIFDRYIKYSYVFRKLNRFDDQKNKLNEVAKYKVRDYALDSYMINLDSDEYFNDHAKFIDQLTEHVNTYDLPDLIFLPRSNVLELSSGEKSAILKNFIGHNGWTWKCDEIEGTNNLLVNLPDYQGRVYKLNNRLSWEGSVHERIVNSRENY